MPNSRPTGPISLQGSVKKAEISEPDASGTIIRLKVVDGPLGAPAALLHPQDFNALPAPANARFLELQKGSDCVSYVAADHSVPPGCIMMDYVQRHNMRLLPGDVHAFRSALRLHCWIY